MSAQRNKRLAWINDQLAKCKSTSAIVRDCLNAFPGTSEKTARADIKFLLERMTEIELENLPSVKTRMMEMCLQLMEESRSLAQMGPAANLFKQLCVISGITEKVDISGSVTNTASPEAGQVRDRIAQLMRNKKVREAAKEAEIDLEKMKDE